MTSLLLLLRLLGAPESPFQAPGLFYQILTSPLHFTLTKIHAALVFLRGRRPIKDKIRIVCISDTHTFQPDIPEADVLIHAGDLTNEGTIEEIQKQTDWLQAQPHRYVVAIAGNHDSYFDPRSRKPQDVSGNLNIGRLRYLQHSETVLEFPSKAGRKLRIYGAPQIPECGGIEHAFQYKRQDDAWTDTIPDDIDILITHTPPKWHLDLACGLGCNFLLKEVWRIKPQLHVFGHIHAGRGQQRVYWDESQRSFERIMDRQDVFDICTPSFWIDSIRVLVYGLLGVIWTRVWGAEPPSTLMVNAGLVDYHGKLVHSPQIVEI